MDIFKEYIKKKDKNSRFLKYDIYPISLYHLQHSI